MLEYNKMILEKVSFYPKLFKKELRKALSKSGKEEIKQLKQWYKEEFSKRQQLTFTK